MAFTVERPRIANCTLNLKRGGSGEPLLYLHGANGAPAIEPFMEELARKYEVFVPEHPGFGASDEPAWLDNIHDLAYFYLEFLEAMKLDRVRIVGSSIGGWLALEMAVRCPGRMRSLSLIGPAGIHVAGLPKGDVFIWSPEERVRNLFHDQSLAERLLSHAPAAEEVEVSLKNQYTVARLAWEPRLYDPHLHKWLWRIRMPVQIVWGENDRILPVGYAQAFKKLMPHARVDVVPECGHLPQTEKAEAFLRLFHEFSATA